MTPRAPKWTIGEIATLREAFTASVRPEPMTALLPGRTAAAIRSRLGMLGLHYRAAVVRGSPQHYGERTARAGRSYTMRPCLTCDRPFPSQGAHNRLCVDCRQSAANASPLDI